MFKPNLKKDVQEMCARALGNRKRDKSYNEYYTVYVKTNEPMREIITNSDFDFANKTGLAILSGGDYPLEFRRRNCSHVDCFDVNRLNFFFSELQIASIKALDFSEYKEFWTYRKEKIECSKILSPIYYRKCAPFLCEEYRIGWDSFMDYVNGDYSRNQVLFATSDWEPIKSKNFISDEKNFYQLKKMLLLEEKINYNYYQFYIKDLWNELPKKTYDFIYFSNALSCTLDMKDSEKRELLLETYENHLNKEGIIFADFYHDSEDFQYTTYLKAGDPFYSVSIEDQLNDTIQIYGRKK